MRKILFFINPVSGTRSKTNLERQIKKKCLENNISFEILFTAADGDYSFLTRKIKDNNITDVVICGGDGTLSPIISFLLHTNIRVGIVPIGSGNGLAFTAKIPKAPDKALDIVITGKTKLIDTFLINEKLSCMLSGIGLDAKVAHDFAKQKTRGFKTYLNETIKNLVAAKPYCFEVKIKGTAFKTEAFFISIANSNQFGNNFIIAPKAKLGDGLLDIIIVKKMSKPLIIWSVLKQMSTGKVLDVEKMDFDKKDIMYFQTDALEIINNDNAPLHIDGDHFQTASKFSIKIIPASVHLIVP